MSDAGTLVSPDDSVPPEARAAFVALLDTLLRSAERHLKKRGAFYPFAAAQRTGGEVRILYGYTGSEAPDPEELIDLAIQGLREDAAAGALAAAGICELVRVTPPGTGDLVDAIGVHLEHRSGFATKAYLPYRRRLLGRYAFGELFAVEKPPRIFGRSGRAAT